MLAGANLTKKLRLSPYNFYRLCEIKSLVLQGVIKSPKCQISMKKFSATAEFKSLSLRNANLLKIQNAYLLQLCRIQLHCYKYFSQSLVAIPDKNPKHQINDISSSQEDQGPLPADRKQLWSLMEQAFASGVIHICHFYFYFNFMYNCTLVNSYI